MDNVALHLKSSESMPEVASSSVQAIIADPPYGISYKTSHRIYSSKVATRVLNDGYGQVWPLLDICIQEWDRVLKPGGVVFMFFSDKEMVRARQVLDQRFDFKHVLTWDKGNWTAGDLDGEWARGNELILMATKGAYHVRGSRPSTILYYPRVPWTQNMVHPMQKPTALLEKLIVHSSDPGDLVLDPFMGSGSTGVAAIHLGRYFVGYEIDPQWFEVAKRRVAQTAMQMPEVEA